MSFSEFPAIPLNEGHRQRPDGLPTHPHVRSLTIASDAASRRFTHPDPGLAAYRDALLAVLESERWAHHKDLQKLRRERDRLVHDVTDLETTCDYWMRAWSDLKARLTKLEFERRVLLREVQTYRGPLPRFAPGDERGVSAQKSVGACDIVDGQSWTVSDPLANPCLQCSHLAQAFEHQQTPQPLRASIDMQHARQSLVYSEGEYSRPVTEDLSVTLQDFGHAV